MLYSVSVAILVTIAVIVAFLLWWRVLLKNWLNLLNEISSMMDDFIHALKEEENE